jgi:guanylate kinase
MPHLLIVSAPSGTGKTSLVRALLEATPDLAVAVSHTTRAPRPGEEDGVHYHFVAADRFAAMVAQGAFLEHAQVFGHRYGTSRGEVERLQGGGADVILEIDWQGARQVRAARPDALSVFVVPPSLAALEARLRGRGQDSEAVIAGRLAKSREELGHYGEFDYLVVNDDFDVALGDLGCLVRSLRLARAEQEARGAGALGELGPGAGRGRNAG